MAKVITNPRIADYCDIDIRRCNASGQDDPKGTNIRIANLQVHLNSQFNVSTHVGEVGIKLSTEQGYRNIDKTTACGSGYKETRPTLFTGQFGTDQNYVFNILVSPAYSYSYSIEDFRQGYTLGKGNCLMDFSSTGGVAIGSFISEGNGKRPDPRFEVGSNLKAYFLGGIEGVSNYDVNSLVNSGGKLTSSGGGKSSVRRFVYELDKQDSGSAVRQYTQHIFDPADTMPIALYGAAYNDNRVIPLPYVGSSGKYISIYIGAAGALNVDNQSGMTINGGYVVYDHADSYS